MTVSKKLLSIAIPTYNRSQLLDKALSVLLPQTEEFIEYVDVSVLNNCSTDNSREVLDKYSAQYTNLTVYNHEVNNGMDWNIIQCYNVSKSKYLLILGDDDIILDGGIRRIIQLLQQTEVGVLYLSSYGFKEDYITERPKKGQTGIQIYNDVETFLKKVNYWITFLSGNVVNKHLLPNDFDSSLHSGTQLPQVNWILSALFNARLNAVIFDYTIAFKTENTGGYRLCEVFGNNLNSIFKYYISQGFHTHYFDIINRNLVLSFFPNLIIILKSGNTTFDLSIEDFYLKLKPLFGKYVYFWIVTVPAITCPVLLARTWMRIVSQFDRILIR